MKSSNSGELFTQLIAVGYTDTGGKSDATGWVYDALDVLMMWEDDADNHFTLLRSLDGGTVWADIGDAEDLFGAPIGVWAGTIAIAARTWLPDKDELLWAGLQPIGVSTQACRIRYTHDNGANWYNKMGNWTVVFGLWTGAIGSSGATGGANCEPLPRVGANA